MYLKQQNMLKILLTMILGTGELEVKQLHSAPKRRTILGGGYISMGRAIDIVNGRAPGYLFAETMATLELNEKNCYQPKP